MILSTMSCVIALGLMLYAYLVDMTTIGEIILFMLPCIPICAFYQKLKTRILICYCLWMDITIILKLVFIPVWVSKTSELATPVNIYQIPIETANFILCIGTSVVWCFISYIIYLKLSFDGLKCCDTGVQLSTVYNCCVRYKSFAFATFCMTAISIDIRLNRSIAIVHSVHYAWVPIVVIVGVILLTYVLLAKMVNMELKSVAKVIQEKEGQDPLVDIARKKRTN